MKRAEEFFTPKERERVRAAVAETERGTSGEIATMVVDASDSYREAEILGAVLLSGLLSVIVAVTIHHVTIWSYIPLVVLLYFPSWYLFRRAPRLKLPFAGRRRLAEAVRERAVRASTKRGSTGPVRKPAFSSLFPYLSTRYGSLGIGASTRRSIRVSGRSWPLSWPGGFGRGGPAMSSARSLPGAAPNWPGISPTGPTM